MQEVMHVQLRRNMLHDFKVADPITPHFLKP
jgi:hypothetical protein